MNKKQLSILAAAVLTLSVQQVNAQSAEAGAGAISGSSSEASSASIGLGLGGGGGSGGSSAANNSISFDNHSIGSDLSDMVPTMFVPNLTTSNGTCANSFSVGGSAPGLGLAFGKTYVSGPCNARFNANQLNALGQADLAAEVMCGIKSVAEADARMTEAYGTIPKCIGNIPPPEEIVEEPTASVIWFDDKEMAEVDELVMFEQSIEPIIWGGNYPDTLGER